MSEIRLGAGPYGMWAAAAKEHFGPLVRRLGIVPTLAIGGYLLLTVTGATTSSIGIAGLRAATPLASAPDLSYRLPNGSPVETVVFVDGDLFRLRGVVPQSMLFAAWWWLPMLLLVLALPPWLRRLGAAPHLAWLATGLTVFAPATAWSSLFPVRVLGFAVAGSYLLLRAADRLQEGRRQQGLALAVVAGVLFARVPTFSLPWSITIGVPVGLATVAWLLWEPASRRAGLVIAGSAVAVTLVLVGLLVVGNHAAISSGLRPSTSDALSAARRFGAPLLGIFQRGPGANSNLSDLPSAYTFTAAWALVVWVGTARRGWDRERAATAVLATFTALWLVWCSIPLGGLGRHLPVVNLVRPERAAQTVGYLAVLVLALVLSRGVGLVRTPVAAAAAGVSALITLYGAVDLRSEGAGPTWLDILATLLVVGLLVFLITWFRDRAWPVVACVVVAALQVLWVNPVVFGSDDLRAGDSAKFARAVGVRAHEQGGYWAADDRTVDALFIANDAPMLSGHQVTGPAVREWQQLDPTGRYLQAWNRGSSYIEFRWARTNTPVITASGGDQIIVRVNPCALPGLGIPLAGIVARSPLQQRCLGFAGTVQSSGRTYYAYSVQPLPPRSVETVTARRRSVPPRTSRFPEHSSRPAMGR